jgi:hypothetical protein
MHAYAWKDGGISIHSSFSISSQGWSCIRCAVAYNLEGIRAKISYYAPYMLQTVQEVAKYNKEVKL